MRRKIAYKKKKECVKMGAMILNNFKLGSDNKKNKKRGYLVDCVCSDNNFPRHCIILGCDELDAYNMLIKQMKNINNGR